MANEKLRIGIIGCGGIANGKHMPALKAQKNAEMVAFCDIIADRAEKARDEFGTPDAVAYTDYKELIARDDIDVVHVCTPNRSHSFITVDALEAGKHVMCEKPMAINSVEAKKMLDAAKRTGKKLSIGYQNRNTPEALYMKMEAEKGTFGDIYFAKAHALRRRGVPTWGVFQDEYEQGGGPLIDIGTHALDLSLWIMNNYKPKYCVGSVFHKLNKTTECGNAWGNWTPESFTVEDSAFGFVVMENGATVIVESSWAINMLDTKEARTTICGTLGGADMMDGLRINGVRNNSLYTLKPELSGKGAAFYDANMKEKPSEREARLWLKSITDPECDPMVLPEQAYCITRILEGIYESGKTGQPYYFNNED